MDKLITDLTEALKANTAAILASNKAGPATTTKASGGTKAADKKADKPKGPTLEDIKEKFGGYLTGVKGEVKATRMAQVQRINEHFGVERATLLDPAQFEEALTFLQAFIDGEEPEGLGGGDEDGESVV